MIERDNNAALNILDEGLGAILIISIRNIVGSSPTEFTPVDYPTMDELEID